MDKNEKIVLIHTIAYKEINYNRSVVNQLLYFSIIIMGAFFWFVLNLKDSSLLGLGPKWLIFALSCCITIIICLIGISICKQFQQERVQWGIINSIQSKDLDKKLNYNNYKINKYLYEYVLMAMFSFLAAINLTIINYSLYVCVKDRLITMKYFLYMPLISIVIWLLYMLFLYYIGLIGGKYEKE